MFDHDRARPQRGGRAGEEAGQDAILKPFDVDLERVDMRDAGFGANGKPDFWIGGEGGLNKPLHVAIVAKDRATVDAFYKAAMAAGGRDNGAPGIRAHYHPNYYGAFVLDPDGHNIEAVCHTPA